MRIASDILAAMAPKDLHDAAQAAIRCARRMEEMDRSIAADWWRALVKQLTDAQIHHGVSAPLPDVPETDIRAATLGLSGWDLRHVAALVCMFRDDQTRSDADRHLWAVLLGELHDYVNRPMGETDLGNVLAAIGGEGPVRRSGFAWTADTAAAIAELDREDPV